MTVNHESLFSCQARIFLNAFFCHLVFSTEQFFSCFLPLCFYAHFHPLKMKQTMWWMLYNVCVLYVQKSCEKDQRKLSHALIKSIADVLFYFFYLGILLAWRPLQGWGTAQKIKYIYIYLYNIMCIIHNARKLYIKYCLFEHTFIKHKGTNKSTNTTAICRDNEHSIFISNIMQKILFRT